MTTVDQALAAALAGDGPPTVYVADSASQVRIYHTDTACIVPSPFAALRPAIGDTLWTLFRKCQNCERRDAQ